MAEVNNLILYKNCLNLYIDSMFTAMNEVDPYLSEIKLMELHETVKNLSIFEV